MPTLATPTTLTTLTLAPFTLLLLDLRLLLFIILCLLTTSGASNRSQELPPWDEQVSCHVCSGACVVWSDGDPRIEVGARGWVAVAKHHSMLLQKVRSIGPLVSGLMGMDMCVGCCQMEVHQRLTAEQVANHPFVLRHMPPEAAGGQLRRRLQRQQTKRTPQRPLQQRPRQGRLQRQQLRSTLPRRQGISRRRRN